MAYTPDKSIQDILDSSWFPWRIFIIDTETTGFKGVMQHHKKNQILQVFCLDLKTGATFDELCKPPGIDYIPELSMECHRISPHDLIGCRSPAEVMDMLIEFIEIYKDDKRPLLIAHNAPFDREMILKSIENKALGYEAHHLGWEWMDTLHEIKIHFPWLKNKYWPEEGPHKLETLMKEFYPRIGIGMAHNAKTDVQNLGRIFCEKLWSFIYQPNKDDHEGHLMFQTYPPNYDTRELSVMDVKGFGLYRTQLIHEKVMMFFRKVPYLREYIVPPSHLFTIGHLYQYALVKWHHEGQQGDCVYKGMCKEIELLLRLPPLQIVDDTTILEMCKLVSGVWGTNDFVNHMMTVQGVKSFFPVLSGTKDNWVGFDTMDDFTCLILKQKFDIGGIHDLFMEYYFTSPGSREYFCRTIQAYFPIDVRISHDTLVELFKQHHLL